MIKQYIVNTFTDTLFEGDSVAICFLENELEENLMKSIAKENRLVETSFVTKKEDEYSIKCFDQFGEKSNGQSIFAAAFILKQDSIVFEFENQKIRATINEGKISIHYPRCKLQEVLVSKEIIESMGARPREAYLGDDLICVFNSEATIRFMHPGFNKVKKLQGNKMHICSKGKNNDYVIRSFSPKTGLNEECISLTGAIHLAELVNETEFIASFKSNRLGQVFVKKYDEFIEMSGMCKIFAEENIYL